MVFFLSKGTVRKVGTFWYSYSEALLFYVGGAMWPFPSPVCVWTDGKTVHNVYCTFQSGWEDSKYYILYTVHPGREDSTNFILYKVQSGEEDSIQRVLYKVQPDGEGSIYCILYTVQSGGGRQYNL